MTTLCHYCSNNAFHSIMASHSIWLSSLSLSNDTMEGKLVARTFAQRAKDEGLDDQRNRGPRLEPWSRHRAGMGLRTVPVPACHTSGVCWQCGTGIEGKLIDHPHGLLTLTYLSECLFGWQRQSLP